ncbi:MAG: hypothetical protein AWL62_2777, partial [Halanaerobium sp. T82-1]|jgi:hypothetical protein
LPIKDNIFKDNLRARPHRCQAAPIAQLPAIRNTIRWLKTFTISATGAIGIKVVTKIGTKAVITEFSRESLAYVNGRG